MKALVSVFFLFLPPLSAFAQGELAPEPLWQRCTASVRLPLLSCLAQSLPRAPTVNLTYATTNFAVVDGGTPVCAVFRQCCRSWRAARLRARALWLPVFGDGALRAWLPAHHPSCRGPGAVRKN